MSDKKHTFHSLLSSVLPDEAVGLDPVAFDALVRGKGVPFLHQRAIPCPSGLIDEGDVHRVQACHLGCSGGFLFRDIGRVTVVFTSNTTDPRRLDEGFFDGSMAMVTFPRFYDDPSDKRVMVHPFDRLYLTQRDLLVSTWDKTHRRNDGLPDKGKFPFRIIDHLIDSHGAWWSQDVDYDVVGGALVWREGRGPIPGTVYSIYYQYEPYFIVDRLLHEIRVIPVQDYINTDEIRMERLAFGAVLTRENVFESQQQDDQAVRGDRRRQPRPIDTPEPQDDF